MDGMTHPASRTEILPGAQVRDSKTGRLLTIRSGLYKGREQVGWFATTDRGVKANIMLPVDYERYKIEKPGRPPKDQSWEATALREKAANILTEIEPGDVVMGGGVPLGVFRFMDDGDYMLEVKGDLIRCDGAELGKIADNGGLEVRKRPAP